VLIDRTHKSWAWMTLGLFVFSTVLYVVYAATEPGGPRGGSVPGLLFGIAGSAAMLFAGLLAARKRFPRWQIGSAQAWLRAHIWFGTLSVPLILFHAGFRLGGTFEQILMAVFAFEIVSGFFGLAMQQAIPRAMKLMAPTQAIYEQISVVCDRLKQSADELLSKKDDESNRAAIPLMQDGPAEQTREGDLRSFYLDEVRPFLSYEHGRKSALVHEMSAAARFNAIRGQMPQRLQKLLGQLEQICDERRQLLAQQRLHAWLHGWLLIHGPAAALLLVLGIIHAITSTYY
jgi:hypothetical protein